MLWRAEIAVVQEEIDPRIVPSLSDVLEVSLDCAHCVRTHRTVIFTVGLATARCTPGSAARSGRPHPPFPGRITDVRVERSAAGYVAGYSLEYEATRFVDTKYGDHRAWTGRPTWARVKWTLTCPDCGAARSMSTQTNLVRPFAVRCECGLRLHHERRELPVLRSCDPAGAWVEAPQRFPAP